MASASADTASPPESESPTFTLQIISPSVGVPQPLHLAHLSVNTTVRQLKERIRNAIDAKPSDQAQRLIHRGRLLARDDDNLLGVFGADAIRSAEPQTLHLVLRDSSDARPATTSIPANPPQNAAPGHGLPANATQAQPPQLPPLRNLNQHAPFPHLPLPQIHQGAPLHNIPFGYQQAMVAGGQAPGLPGNPAATLNAPHLAHIGNQLAYQQRLLADHHRLQELINHNQRERAAMGLNGAQDYRAGVPAAPGNHAPGRNASPQRPDNIRTTVREGFGPGGQRWHITLNETVTTQQNAQRNPTTESPSAPDLQNRVRSPTGAPLHPPSVPLPGPHGGPLSGADLHNMLRAADAGQAATRVMSDALRRNTSNSSLLNLVNNQAAQPIPPGVTTPLVPSRTGSAMGTSEPTRAAGSNGQAAYPAQPQHSTSPEVYILSSPEGPRALLMNGNAGQYFTPHAQQPQVNPNTLRRQLFYQQVSPFGFLPGMHAPQDQQHQQQQFRAATGGPWAPPPLGDHGIQHNQQYQQPQGPPPLPQGLPQLPQAQPHIGHAVAQPGNVQVRAIAVAQIWPHIWMVIRLLLFVWWFTSPTASWQRWFTVMAIAFSLFLVNTGLLTPLAEQFWTPVRRHLDNIMPAADNHGRGQPARAERTQGGNENAATQGGGGDPNPVEAAARLVRERRAANGNWLMAQARRLERAGILFLASIAPGVAERHIAHLEAEARAERQRQEAAEAAAAEAVRLAAENAQNEQGNSGGENGPAPEPARDEAENARRQHVEEPLIAI